MITCMPLCFIFAELFLFLFFGISCLILLSKPENAEVGLLILECFLFNKLDFPPPQFDAILLLSRIRMNIPHDPNLNFSIKIKLMHDHSVAEKKEKKLIGN